MTEFNLLKNPGFESGDFSGWSLSFSPPVEDGVARDALPIDRVLFPDAQVNVRSGDYAAWLKADIHIPFPSDLLTLGLSQTLTLEPNTRYELGFWFSDGSSAGNALGIGGTIYINDNFIPDYYWDGVVTILNPGFPHFYAGQTATNFTHFESFYETSNREEHVTVRFSLGTLPGLAFSVDDFTVQPIPEPTVLTLLVLSLLMFCVRKAAEFLSRVVPR